MEIPLPAIVIPAYNRPESLRRLLDSLLRADYPEGDIRLIISLEGEGSLEVAHLAESCEWPFGTKEIIRRETRLGLKQHVLQCADLVRKYQAVILLEDDLMVGKGFFHYAAAAMRFFEGRPEVACMGLYSYQLTENGFFPFVPLDDGFDNYFIQAACSWGQVWTLSQWDPFVEWLKKQPKMIQTDGWPAYLNQWGKYSWKKHFTRYLVDTNKYVAYPRNSFSTVFQAGGTSPAEGNIFQVPLSGKADANWTFSTPENSLARYDAWFEPKPDVLKQLDSGLQPYDFQVDMRGTLRESEIHAPYLLSGRICKHPINAFGLKLSPPEANIRHQIPGSELSLGKSSDFEISDNPEFYYRMTAMRAIQIGKGADKFVDEIDFANPDFSFVIWGIEASREAIKATVNSIPARFLRRSRIYLISELTPEAQHVISVRPTDHKGAIEALQSVLTECHTEFQGLIPAGAVFREEFFLRINLLTQNFRWIQWFSEGAEAPPTGGMADFRWDLRLYHKRLNAQIQLPVSFWRTALVSDNLPENIDPKFPLASIWLHLFKVGSPSPVATAFFKEKTGFRPQSDWDYRTLAQLISPEVKPPGFLAALSFPFFKMDTPGFRSIYISKTQLPLVLRWDEIHNFWYQQGY